MRGGGGARRQGPPCVTGPGRGRSGRCEAEAAVHALWLEAAAGAAAGPAARLGSLTTVDVSQREGAWRVSGPVGEGQASVWAEALTVWKPRR